MRLGGGGAGTCRTWIAASLVRPGEDDDPKGAEDGETERREYVFDQMEAMMSEDGLQADERMCDSIDSVGTMLRKIYGSESEEDGEETMEAKEQIVRVTDRSPQVVQVTAAPEIDYASKLCTNLNFFTALLRVTFFDGSPIFYRKLWALQNIFAGRITFDFIQIWPYPRQNPM
jgi:hypothetical protein